jgi:hypothetical protein
MVWIRVRPCEADSVPVMSANARGLYYGVGFRPFTRDAPLIKAAVSGP